MRVVFHKEAARRYFTHIHRDDGVVVWMPGFDRKWRVPHDLAHFVAERELGLADGIFGSLAAGAMFENMEVVSGRSRRDPKALSARILRVNGESGALGFAEMVGGVVHAAAETGSTGGVLYGARWAWMNKRRGPFPYVEADLLGAVAELRALTDEWQRVRPGGRLELPWPLAVPALPRPARTSEASGRSRRRARVAR